MQQHDFRYVSKEKTEKTKEELLCIINEVKRLVREEYHVKLEYRFVGSCTQNMITEDKKSNIGYDFDVNLYITNQKQYSPEDFRKIFRNALHAAVSNYCYMHCEDSTRVLTLRYYAAINSCILHSFDFAIVYDRGDGCEEYIRFNKHNKTYTWEQQPKGYPKQKEKIEWLKKNGYWNELRNYYLKKKNENNDSNKKSRSIFAESLNEMCQKKDTETNV